MEYKYYLSLVIKNLTRNEAFLLDEEDYGIIVIGFEDNKDPAKVASWISNKIQAMLGAT